MSVASLTTLAAVRAGTLATTTPYGDIAVAAKPAAQPTKQDLGKLDPSQANAPASISDILVTQVPTELVAPYTALTAAIVGAVAEPTATNRHPDQLAAYRWAAFAMLVVLVIVSVWAGKWRKSGKGKFPLLAVLGAVVAAVGWAFALPGSPLIPYIHGMTGETLVPLFVAFGAIGFASLTAVGLQSPERQKTP